MSKETPEQPGEEIEGELIQSYRILHREIKSVHSRARSRDDGRILARIRPCVDSSNDQISYVHKFTLLEAKENELERSKRARDRHIREFLEMRKIIDHISRNL